MRLNITQKKWRKKMENKINIAEILRDYPKGTKLYSPLFGKCELVGVDTDEYGDFIRIEVFFQNGHVKESGTFSSDGRYFEWYPNAECVLFPSERMRCWSKFFKRGDVLADNDLETVVIFNGWANDDYTEFNTTINYDTISKVWDKEDICRAVLFHKATNEERAEFIAAAEKHYGGKYNPETLQVEPIKVAEPKCPFEPFQRVLVRDEDDDVWKADYFSHYKEDDEIAPYVCVGSYFRQCIPYEGSEHLLGTDKSPE